MINPTFVLSISLIGFLLIGFLLWCGSLWLGLNMLSAEQRRWPAIFKAGLLVQIGTILINLVLLLVCDQLPPWLFLAAQLILIVGFTCSVLSTMFSLSLGKSLLAWLVTLASQVVVFGLAAFVYKPFVFEAFHAPTNSMAPTIMGDHARVACPVCGKPAYATIHPGNPIPHRVICDDFHISTGDELRRAQPEVVEQIAQDGIHSYDHFLAAKFLKPRRWDMITFHWPEDPEILYIKRVIGLPGETVVIRDGSVWINGERLEPPPELKGIKYYGEEMTADFFFQGLNGTESNPALLGPDEYFVLGDFTAAASDSRFWKKGAPGHKPFAVPADSITGVVTHTFWPWSRIRSFPQH